MNLSYRLWYLGLCWATCCLRFAAPIPLCEEVSSKAGALLHSLEEDISTKEAWAYDGSILDHAAGEACLQAFQWDCALVVFGMELEKLLGEYGLYPPVNGVGGQRKTQKEILAYFAVPAGGGGDGDGNSSSSSNLFIEAAERFYNYGLVSHHAFAGIVTLDRRRLLELSRRSLSVCLDILDHIVLAPAGVAAVGGGKGPDRPFRSSAPESAVTLYEDCRSTLADTYLLLRGMPYTLLAKEDEVLEEYYYQQAPIPYGDEGSLATESENACLLERALLHARFRRHDVAIQMLLPHCDANPGGYAPRECRGTHVRSKEGEEANVGGGCCEEDRSSREGGLEHDGDIDVRHQLDPYFATPSKRQPKRQETKGSVGECFCRAIEVIQKHASVSVSLSHVHRLLDAVMPLGQAGYHFSPTPVAAVHGESLAHQEGSGPTARREALREAAEQGDDSVPATVGIFLLLGQERMELAAAHPLLCRSLLHLWRSPEHRATVARCRLHVIGSISPAYPQQEESFRRALGEAADHLWGGYHLVRGADLPQYAWDGNYLRKVYSFYWLSASLGYTHVMSVDDDIIISPYALASLVSNADKLTYTPHPPGGEESKDRAREEEGQAEAGEMMATAEASNYRHRSAKGTEGAEARACSILSPALSTGIPSTEMWIDAHLLSDSSGREDAVDAEAILKCFAQSTVPEGDLQTFLGSSYLPMEQGWNSSAHYAQVQAAIDAGHLLQPTHTHSYGAGLHPVRWNRTCSEQLARVVERLLPKELLVDRSHEVVHEPTGKFPYLCNSIWVAPLSLVYQTLTRFEWMRWSHPFDEAVMNKIVHEEQLDLCFVRNAFAVHPTYLHDQRDRELVFSMHIAADKILSEGLSPRESEKEGEGIGRLGMD